MATSFRETLKTKDFIVTAEAAPIKGSNVSKMVENTELLKDKVDALNVTDNQSSVMRYPSLGTCLLIKEHGGEPVLQVTCRDRNRIALQMDVLGAAALGMNNVLCLSGDYMSFGNHPEAKGVYDIDSVQFVKIVKDMRDEKKFQCGEEMKVEPRLFIGAAANPFAAPFEYRPYRLAEKVAAGAEFIQTQMVYNVPKFREYMSKVSGMGLDEKVYILAGVGPIKSLGTARYMAANVPGMDVPDKIVDRMKKTPKEKRADEGIKICTEIIQQVREIPGINGVHIMAIEWEEAVPKIVEGAGLDLERNLT